MSDKISDICFWQVHVTPKLRTLMVIKNVTICDMAKMLGYERKAVSMWINGKKIPSVMNFQAICSKLGTTIDFMLDINKSLNINYGDINDIPNVAFFESRHEWLRKHHRCVICAVPMQSNWYFAMCKSCQQYAKRKGR